MHELSLCRAVAATAEQHAAGRRVDAVRLRIGHFRQVVPETMQQSWAIQVRDTTLDGARLDIDHVPAVIVCRDCGATTTLTLPVLRCGACDGTATDLVSGEEFLIASIDVTDARPSTDPSPLSTYARTDR